jgi:predicted RNA-binding Zn-ribbon protein involved in translation (DUF1610 family)
MKAPKCRNCGKEEWRHVCQSRAAAVSVTSVTPPITRVTPKAGEKIEPAVLVEGACPTCGHVAKVRSATAERQAAYRARKKGGAA